MLVDLERGWQTREESDHQRTADLCTFALTGLLGGVCGEVEIVLVRALSAELARLGAKYGPEIELNELLRQLAGDCPHWTWSARWPEGCGAYYPDLEPPMRPPDLPSAPLRLIRGGKKK